MSRRLLGKRASGHGIRADADADTDADADADVDADADAWLTERYTAHRPPVRLSVHLTCPFASIIFANMQDLNYILLQKARRKLMLRSIAVS